MQTEIKDTQRAFLIEWIIDVHRKFRMAPETLYVAVFMVDTFLSRQKVTSSQLHKIGVTVLLVSTKYEEIYPPNIKDLLVVSENKFKKEEIIAMEKEILAKLNYNVTTPSHYRFLQRFSRFSTVTQDRQVFFYAQYLLEISLLDASFLRFLPSQLAAASLILSSK